MGSPIRPRRKRHPSSERLRQTVRTMRFRFLGALTGLVIGLGSLAAQTDATDEFIRAEMKRQRIPGLSLAVVKDGRVVKAQGYGFADIQAKAAATPDTVYKIASVSKPLIASAVMKLAQDRRLGVDDPVSKYLAGTPESWSKITIRHLLSHTSGLIREGPAFDPMKVRSDAEVVKSAYSAPLRFPPGERYEYGNVNYFALAEIIRTVSGRPWTDYMREEIFTPSGMTSTWPTNTTVNIPRLATGYVDNDNPRPAPRWVALRPSGAFLSTVLDLVKWDAALDARKVLSDDTLRQMWTPTKLADGRNAPYGLGWFAGSPNGRARVQHTGGMPGTRAGFVKYPDDRLTLIVLMNLDDVDIDSIVEGLAALYLGRGGA